MTHQNNAPEFAGVTPDSISESSTAGFDIEALSPRQLRVVLVCDVVESVRWMEHDEDNAITRWSQFAAAVRSRIAPEHAGSVVKTTGDGLMLEFESAPQAVAAANAMQKLAGEGNAGYAGERQMHLRIGIHQAQVRRDAHDLYGHGVNLAARISTLAGPGEIIVTPEVRDHLTDSLDGDIEDMGECYLKHLSEPQRVYRFSGAFTAVPESRSQSFDKKLLDTGVSIVVFPFQLLGTNDAEHYLGHLIADTLTSNLSQTDSLTVVSRLSAVSIASRGLGACEVGQLLNVGYIVSGSAMVRKSTAHLRLELAETRHGSVVDSFQWSLPLEQLCQPLNEFSIDAVAHISKSIMSHVISLIQTEGLPTIRSSSILMAAINQMHYASNDGSNKAHSMLQYLTEQHQRHSKPYAWLANWHALRVSQNQSATNSQDLTLALSFAQKAIDLDSSSSLAHAVASAIQMNLTHDFGAAKKHIDKALSHNPNDAMVWAYKSILHGFQGEANQALTACEKTLALTPLDPLRHYYETLSASAALGARSFELARQLATKSLRANRLHASTFRILAIAQMLCDLPEDARETVTQLKALLPEYSLNNFKKLSPLYQGPYGIEFANALSDAGL